MKRFLLTLLVAVATLTITAQAEIAPEKREEITKMLQVTGMEKMVGQMMQQMMGQMKSAYPAAPEAFWTKMAKGMDAKELIDLIVPIYDKYYTIEDLKAINAFYATPAGQKVITTLPQVMQESMAAGQVWGQKVAAKVVEELKAEKIAK